MTQMIIVCTYVLLAFILCLYCAMEQLDRLMRRLRRMERLQWLLLEQMARQDPMEDTSLPQFSEEYLTCLRAALHGTDASSEGEHED